MIVAALALVSAIGACPVETSSAAVDGSRRIEDASLLGAAGYARLVADDLDAAVDCLRGARDADPNSAIYARDLAVAFLAKGALVEALASIDAALALGDRDPEALLIRATILAELGRDIDALETIEGTDTWEADLFGAALAERHAVRRAIPLLEEPTKRGALASLVLASVEGAEGTPGATRLAKLAATRAADAGAPSLVAASQELLRVLETQNRPDLALRLRTTFDHATNPAFLARGREPRRAGLRLAFAADGRFTAPLGPLATLVEARVDQHVYVVQRETYDRLDITALRISAAVQYPLSDHPSLAVLGVSARFVDVFGDLFETHYATSIEGGPDLTLELDANLRIRLGVYGVATDVVDTSPPDDVVSSLNRDHVGQRAVLSLFGELDRFAGSVSVAFLHDDALGDAFDAIGGELAGRIVAYPTRDVQLFTGVGLTLREFGAVGDLAVIGPAATRTQLRIVAELGVRVELAKSLFLILEDTWIDNQARDGHEYVSNIVSVGAEVLF